MRELSTQYVNHTHRAVPWPFGRFENMLLPQVKYLTVSLFALFLSWNYARAEVTEFTVLPSRTDPDITTFDSPHHFYVNREIVVEHKVGLSPDRHQLLLWLTGTGGEAKGAARAFCLLAANCGYQVISLMYPDEIAATVCRNDEDPRAFESFRLAIIQGGSSEHISVTRSDSIENRLIKALQRVHSLRPAEAWGGFLTEQGDIRWDAIAVAGQSQGGGHAALIGIKHCVARVICTGAPKDYSKKLVAPAAWYSQQSATPKNRFFAFNHKQDPVGCTPQELAENLHALGLDLLGSPVDVATQKLPFHHTRILTTSYPSVTVTGKRTVAGKNSEGARTAHTSVIDSRNAERWKDVWLYLLTEH